MYSELRFLKGPRSGSVFPISTAQATVIGRSPKADLTIRDRALSRRHCVIDVEGETLRIKDLGSKNGTYLNGERLGSRPVALKGGDRLVLGSNAIQIFSDADFLDAEKKCLICGRTISLETFVEESVEQQSAEEFICPECREKQRTPDIRGYECGEILGAGNLGVIYKALQTSMQRTVAIKVLHPELTRSEKQVARFYREAETAASLTHKNIIQIYNAGESNGFYFIVMEYVEGKTFLQHINAASRHRLPVPFVVRIAGQLAEALIAAFKKGVIHRDIKPSNILVNESGIPKLVDFGLAKNYELTGSTALTAEGQGMGTFAYLPPEQLDDAVNADHRSDIYSVGATMYHALVGHPPILAKTPREFFGRILNYVPKSARKLNKSVPKKLARIVAKCLEKERDKRYQTPEAFKDALDDV